MTAAVEKTVSQGVLGGCRLTQYYPPGMPAVEYVSCEPVLVLGVCEVRELATSLPALTCTSLGHSHVYSNGNEHPNPLLNKATLFYTPPARTHQNSHAHM